MSQPLLCGGGQIGHSKICTKPARAGRHPLNAVPLLPPIRGAYLEKGLYVLDPEAELSSDPDGPHAPDFDQFVDPRKFDLE